MSDDDYFCDQQAKIANGILAKLQKGVAVPNSVTHALTLLLRRLVSAGNSLRVLGDDAATNFGVDGAMILRGVYDAMLQAIYILQGDQEARAKLYLEFAVVEQWRMAELMLKSKTEMGTKFAASQRRDEFEPQMEQEYNRVRKNYESVRKEKNGKEKIVVRDHWYEGNLRELARKVGYESEYELFQKQFSGYVHSSAFSLSGKNYPTMLLITLCWRFSYRVLGRFAKYTNTPLDSTEQKVTENANRNAYDKQ